MYKAIAYHCKCENFLFQPKIHILRGQEKMLRYRQQSTDIVILGPICRYRYRCISNTNYRQTPTKKSLTLNSQWRAELFLTFNDGHLKLTCFLSGLLNKFSRTSYVVEPRCWEYCTYVICATYQWKSDKIIHKLTQF